MIRFVLGQVQLQRMNRNRFKLVENMEEKRDIMGGIIKNINGDMASVGKMFCL